DALPIFGEAIAIAVEICRGVGASDGLPQAAAAGIVGIGYDQAAGVDTFKRDNIDDVGEDAVITGGAVVYWEWLALSVESLPVAARADSGAAGDQGMRLGGAA